MTVPETPVCVGLDTGAGASFSGLTGLHSPVLRVVSGRVGSVCKELRGRPSVALVDKHLRPTRKHERKGATRIVCSDRRLVPRPIGSYRDQLAHFARMIASRRRSGVVQASRLIVPVVSRTTSC